MVEHGQVSGVFQLDALPSSSPLQYEVWLLSTMMLTWAVPVPPTLGTVTQSTQLAHGHVLAHAVAPHGVASHSLSVAHQSRVWSSCVQQT